MKKYCMLIVSMILFQGFSNNSYAQCSPGCKKKQQISKTFSCKLTSSELRNRKQQIISMLKGKVLEKKDLPNGYSFKFNESNGMLDSITSLVKSERLCCDFLNFKITISSNSVIWFDIYGPRGVKEFMATELEM